MGGAISRLAERDRRASVTHSAASFNRGVSRRRLATYPVFVRVKMVLIGGNDWKIGVGYLIAI